MDRLVFVWDCDAGLVGHVRYAWEKLRGRSCALCDLSYVGLRPSEAYEACRAALPIPLEPLYRDQISPALALLLGGAFPAVVHEREGEVSILLGPDELGAMTRFQELEAALREVVGPEHDGEYAERS